MLLPRVKRMFFESLTSRSISGYSIDHNTFTNVPRDVQELLPQGHPTSIEEEIQMNGLKLGA